MRIWPNSRQALVLTIIMFINIFLFGDRGIQWTPNQVYIAGTVVSAIILTITLIKERRRK